MTGDDQSAGAVADAAGEVLMDVCVSPDVCDERDHLRADVLFEWIDAIAALTATRYGRLPGVPVTLDGCQLRDPVLLGDRIAVRGRVVYSSRRSLGVSVAIDVTGKSGAPRAGTTAYLTFVFPTGDGALAAVTPHAPETEADAARHREGDLRRQFHRELSRDRSVLSRPELLLVGAPESRRESPVFYLLRELGGRLATRRRRSGAGVRSPETSYIHRIEPVRGARADHTVFPGGALHGGALMRWIETCAAMSASAFVDAPVRLVGVHGVAFQRPVPPSVFVHVYAIAVHTDDEGLSIHVTVTAENPLTGDTVDAVRGFLTYAPIDADVAVPAVARPGPTEAALFCEVSLRKALRDRIATPPRRATTSRPE